MIKGSKAHFKVMEKHRDFSEGLILVGGLPRLKNSQKWKFFKSNFNPGHFKLAFHLMDSVGIFSNEICKTRYLISQSLDDMHASLPDLKYRPPISSLSSCCLTDEDLLPLIWVIFVAWLSSPLKLAHVSLFSDLFTQLSLCGAHRDPFICWRFLTRQIIWKDLFIAPRFTDKNIRCHLLKGSNCLS